MLILSLWMGLLLGILLRRAMRRLLVMVSLAVLVCYRLVWRTFMRLRVLGFRSGFAILSWRLALVGRRR